MSPCVIVLIWPLLVLLPRAVEVNTEHARIFQGRPNNPALVEDYFPFARAVLNEVSGFSIFKVSM